jgi:methylphosphotriester-DNA--protein-cysteine methyltransferase
MGNQNTARVGVEADAERWRAVLARSADADGRFFYAVRTTGVYCRPTCPSRRPRRENVEFFATTAQAEAGGFRACRRCTPSNGHGPVSAAERVRRACRLIDEAEDTPDLKAIAQAAGLSPFHFHRLFRRLVGVTPREILLREMVSEARLLVSLILLRAADVSLVVGSVRIDVQRFPIFLDHR